MNLFAPFILAGYYIYNMRFCLPFLFFFSFINVSLAQPSFLEFQKTYPKVVNAFKLREDTLKKQFEKAGLQFPPKQLYIRSFKYDSQLEVWVKNELNEPFKLFKTYKVCAMAGSLGPKRMEGDYQVPEGFYHLNEMNPRSMYNFSLGVNYPNASDKILSDSIKPGGDIYIHGNCITVGCIPITDVPIEELYVLTAHAKNIGQDFIPIHIFPVRYSNPKSAAYLERIVKDETELKQFNLSLKAAYDYFEAKRDLPLILVDKEGKYLVYVR